MVTLYSISISTAGNLNQADLRIIASDYAEADTLDYGSITFVGTVNASIGNICIYPGSEDWMPIFIDAEECYCLGGFILTIAYDDSILTLTDVRLGSHTEDYSDYFDVIFNPEAGTVTFVYLAQPGSEICGDLLDYPVLYIKFYVDPTLQYPVNFSLPIDFYTEDNNHDLNSVTDRYGYTLWRYEGCDNGGLDLQLTGGSMNIPDEGDHLLGDFNSNGYPFEAGDAVIMYNALLDPIDYFLSDAQLRAGNFDLDYNYLTIYDIFCYFQNFPMFQPGNDFPVEYDCQPENDTLLLESWSMGFGDEFMIPLYLINHDTIFAFQACLHTIPR